MKLITAILISLSYPFVVNCQPSTPTCLRPEISEKVRPEPQPNEFKGSIKTIKTFVTWFVRSEKTGRVEKHPRTLESETKYDDLGDTGRSEGFSAGIDVEVTSIHDVCGADGRLKELRFVIKDGSSFPGITYAYDEKGRLREMIGFYQNGSIQIKAIYVYDTVGNLIEEAHTNLVHPVHFTPRRYDVYVTSKNTYKYDTRGNKIEERVFSPDGVMVALRFFNYDSSDRLSKKTRMDKLWNLEGQTLYEYDTDGRLLTETDFREFCLTHDGDFCKGSISSGEGFFYYATKTKYRYDSQGNWIRKTEWSMDSKAKKPAWEISKITEREITYRTVQRLE